MTTPREKALGYIRGKLVGYFEAEDFEAGKQAEHLLSFLEGLTDKEYETDEREEESVIV